jgi:hypothetical protein
MKLLIAGCSYAIGCGLPGEQDNPKIWANQLAQKLDVTSITNVAKSGANNQYIFLETMSAMIKNHYDVIIVSWSTLGRLNFRVGLEQYSVDTMLTGSHDVNILGGQLISKKWLAETGDRLRKIHNDHWDLLDLVKYINVLVRLQSSTNGKIFFVNGIGGWSDQYFVKKQIQLPSDLDSYTYNLLDVDMRDDEEILKLYNMIHSHYEEYGGIHEELWLNLYQSLAKMKIDSVSSDDPHPGFLSQDLFFDFLYKQITDKIK